LPNTQYLWDSSATSKTFEVRAGNDLANLTRVCSFSRSGGSSTKTAAWEKVLTYADLPPSLKLPAYVVLLCPSNSDFYFPPLRLNGAPTSGAPAWLGAGDFVRLAAVAPAPVSWCLGAPAEGREGVVLLAPLPRAGAAEQRMVLVASLDGSGLLGPASWYRGAWLERAPPQPRSTFAPGDRVALNECVSVAPSGRPFAGKCLGLPATQRYGVVVAVGPVRDGVQRNVEVRNVAGSGLCPAPLSHAACAIAGVPKLAPAGAANPRRHPHPLLAASHTGYCNLCKQKPGFYLRCAACDWDECAGCYAKNTGAPLPAGPSAAQRPPFTPTYMPAATSYYPATALRRAALSAVLASPEDASSLRAAACAALASAGLDAAAAANAVEVVETLLPSRGLNVWGALARLIGENAAGRACLEWHRSRQAAGVPHWPLTREAKPRLRSPPPPPKPWRCAACSFAQSVGDSCGACGVKSPLWVCLFCDEENAPSRGTCRVCAGVQGVSPAPNLGGGGSAEVMPALSPAVTPLPPAGGRGSMPASPVSTRYRAHCVARLRHGDTHVTALGVVAGMLVSGGPAHMRTWEAAGDNRGVRSAAGSARGGVAWLEAPGAYATAGGAGNCVEVFNAATGAKLQRLVGHSDYVYCVVSLLGGAQFASGSKDKTVRVWDQCGLQLAELNGHADSVTSLAVLPDGTLVSGSYDRTVKLWNLATRVCTLTLQHPNSVWAVAVLPDGRIAAACADNKVHVWSAAGVEEAVLEGHSDRVYALAVLDDGLLASAGADKRVRVWDVAAKTELLALTGHAGDIYALAALPGRRLASGSDNDSFVRVWALTASGTPEDDAAAAAAFNCPDREPGKEASGTGKAARSAVEGLPPWVADVGAALRKGQGLLAACMTDDREAARAAFDVSAGLLNDLSAAGARASPTAAPAAAAAPPAAFSGDHEEAAANAALHEGAFVAAATSLSAPDGGSPLPADASHAGTPEPLSATAQRDASAPFCEPLAALSDFSERRGRGLNTVLHIAAALGLRRSFSALQRAAGLNQWVPNRNGDTAIGLLERMPHQANVLHRRLRLRAIVGEEFARVVVRGVEGGGGCGAAPACSPPPCGAWEAIAEARAALLEERPKDVIALLQGVIAGAAADPESARQARVYHAIALLEDGWDVKAARAELAAYEAVTVAAAAAAAGEGGASPSVAPLYFYALYLAWRKSDARKLSRQKARAARLAGADALAAARLLGCAPEWLREDDVVDLEVAGEGGDDFMSPDAHDEEAEEDLDEGEPEPGAPEFEWRIAKADHAAVSPSMDKLMAMTGLRQVKERAMTVFKEVLLSRGRPADLNTDVAMNFLFVGNPGCGKTMVAELMAHAMEEVGYRKQGKPVITSANKILTAKDPVQEFADCVKKAEGGCLFIDEIYQFSPSPPGTSANPSSQVLDKLMEVSETLRLTTSFILAGYEEDVDRVVGYNPGFASRFPVKFTFSDYTEAQLKNIFLGMLRKDGYALQTKRECGVSIASILAARVAQAANTKGFANARTVRGALDRAKTAQSTRLGTPALMGSEITERAYRTLTREDVLGPPPDLEKSPLLAELNSLVGQPRVKTAVRQLMDLQLQNYEREARGEKPLRISLHKIFSGNPGTGKTTVAKLYGALLKSFGFLSDGTVRCITASDLVGSAVGEAAVNTAEQIKQSKGKVLFIDEAYVLDPTRGGNGTGAGGGGGNAGYNQAVIDTMVQKLSGEVGDDIAVILAGYTHDMESLLRNSGNDGFRRRFSPADAIQFDDFSDEELLAILKRRLAADGLLVRPDVAQRVIAYIARDRKMDGFGNADAVRAIVDRAKKAQASRLQATAAEARRRGRAAAATAAGDGAAAPGGPARRPAALAAADSPRDDAAAAAAAAALLPARVAAPPSPPAALPQADLLLEEDFYNAEQRLEAGKAHAALDKLYFTERIREVVEEIEATVEQAKADGRSADHVLARSHLVFVGEPGTGKSTVARLFGTIFHNLEVLPTARVTSVLGRSLQGQFVGQTQALVREKMREAKGGVLLIDEAYGLSAGVGGSGTFSSFGREAVDTLVGCMTEPEFDGKLLVIMCGYEADMDAMFAVANPGFKARFDKRRVRFDAWDGAQAAAFAEALAAGDGKQFTEEAGAALRVGFAQLAAAPKWGSARVVVDFNARLYSAMSSRLAAERKARSAAGAAGGGGGGSTGAHPPVAPLKGGARAPTKPAAPSSATYELVDVDAVMAQLQRDRRRSAPSSPRRSLPSTPPATMSSAPHSDDESSVGSGRRGNSPPPPPPPPQRAPPQEKLKFKTREAGPQGGDGNGGGGSGGDPAWLLLETAFGLGYGEAEVEKMLDARDFPEDLESAMKAALGVDTIEKAREVCRAQAPGALARVRTAIKQRADKKSAEEAAVQLKLRTIGKCCMGFDWLRDGDAGYRCAGGSHYCTKAELEAT
jgi:SpoVK/Ycf46/Vps4 family AAA+-type ATPase